MFMLSDHYHQKKKKKKKICGSLRVDSNYTCLTIIKHYSDLNFTCIKSPISECQDGLVNLRLIAEPGKRPNGR